MTSRFGWLDADEQQRRTMMEVIALFRDPGTVDELGIGTIRDTISNALFPGTSVLLTRLRYALFVPWLMSEAAATASSGERAVQRLRRSEEQLIESLIAGTADLPPGEAAGIVGRRARAELKTMPSVTYWGALGAWGIRTWDESVEGHVRRSVGLRGLARTRPSTDEPDSRDDLAVSGFDPGLPGRPDDLLTGVDFRLRQEESEFIAHRIRVSTAGSLLAWLVDHPPLESASFAWDLPHITSAPEPMLELLEHGRRMSVLTEGAALLYNLMLAEESGQPDLTDGYRDALGAWHGELHADGRLGAWDLPTFWATLMRHDGRITSATRVFIEAWHTLAVRSEDPAASTAARDLIARRERQIKGARARIGNRSALDKWTGASGVGRLDYRWGTSQRLLGDLHPVAEAARARS